MKVPQLCPFDSDESTRLLLVLSTHSHTRPRTRATLTFPFLTPHFPPLFSLLDPKGNENFVSEIDTTVLPLSPLPSPISPQPPCFLSHPLSSPISHPFSLI